jgi:hypothetical protein
MSRKTSKARSALPPFPQVIYLNGRGYNWRSHLEHYKSQLVRQALGVRPEPPPTTRTEHDVLVPLKVAGAELGVGRRTIGRRIAEARQSAIV